MQSRLTDPSSSRFANSSAYAVIDVSIAHHRSPRISVSNRHTALRTRSSAAKPPL